MELGLQQWYANKDAVVPDEIAQWGIRRSEAAWEAGFCINENRTNWQLAKGELAVPLAGRRLTFSG
jgi:hypothetical protein